MLLKLFIHFLISLDCFVLLGGDLDTGSWVIPKRRKKVLHVWLHFTSVFSSVDGNSVYWLRPPTSSWTAVFLSFTNFDFHFSQPTTEWIIWNLTFTISSWKNIMKIFLHIFSQKVFPTEAFVHLNLQTLFLPFFSFTSINISFSFWGPSARAFCIFTAHQKVDEKLFWALPDQPCRAWGDGKVLSVLKLRRLQITFPLLLTLICCSINNWIFCLTPRVYSFLAGINYSWNYYGSLASTTQHFFTSASPWYCSSLLFFSFFAALRFMPIELTFKALYVYVPQSLSSFPFSLLSSAFYVTAWIKASAVQNISLTLSIALNWLCCFVWMLLTQLHSAVELK